MNPIDAVFVVQTTEYTEDGKPVDVQQFEPDPTNAILGVYLTRDEAVATVERYVETYQDAVREAVAETDGAKLDVKLQAADGESDGVVQPYARKFTIQSERGRRSHVLVWCTRVAIGKDVTYPGLTRQAVLKDLFDRGKLSADKLLLLV